MIEFWQNEDEDEKKTHSIEEAKEKFADCVFLGV